MWAQTAGTASISGQITDPNGLAVSGARVIIRNTETGAERTITTGSEGLYSAPLLKPGHYDVEVFKEGFNTITRKGATLEVGQALPIDVKLTIKGAKETVTVTAEAPRVDTEKSDVSTVVAEYQVENLPLANRRWDNLVLLTPGVSEDGGFGLVSFRGISALYNNNMVDGADNNQAFFSEARGRTRLPYGYSMEAIQEFNVTTAAYSAEYGRAAGGVVNAITKSGGNAIHGDGYYFIRPTTTEAEDSLAKSRGASKPDDRRQFFGGSIGGPIKKDKLFYFASYDQFRRDFPMFVATSKSNFFKATPLNDSGSQADNCLQGASAALITECNSILSSLSSLYNMSVPRNGLNNIGLGKIDWQINQNNRISTVVNILRWESPNGVQTAPSTNVSALADGLDGVKNEFLTVSWNSAIRPTLVNDARFQYGRDFEFQSPNAGGPSFGWGSSSIGGADFGMPNFLPRGAFPNEKRFEWVDNVSWMKGRHQFKSGVDINYVRDGFQNLFQGGGVYTYSSSTALKLLATDIVNVAAGTPTYNYTTFTQAGDPITGSGTGFFTTTDYNFYFQDNIRLSSSWTFNVGLRYELETMPAVQQANPAVPETSHLNTDTNNIGPRVGFAWNVGGHSSQVLRGGYGLYYARTQNSTLETFLFQNGVFQQTFAISPRNLTAAQRAACAPVAPNLLFPQPSTAPPLGPIFGTSGPTPAPLFASVGDFLSDPTCQTLPSTATIDTLDPHFVNPLVHEYDLSYERELPGSLTLSLNYVGSRGQRLPVFVDANLPAPDQTAAYLFNGNIFTVPFFSGAGAGARPRINPATGRPLGVVLMGRSVLNSWYNGLVVRVSRRMAHGFSFDSNFTWSQARDNGQVPGNFGTFTGTDSPLNPYDLGFESGVSDLDVRRRWITNFYWETPFANWTSNQTVKHIVGGWRFSSVSRVQDGHPVTSNMTLPFAFTCGTGDGGLTCGSVSSNAGFTNGRFPFYPRNALVTAPGFLDFDFRVNREIKTSEHTHLELLAEAFNIFNRANVFGVNTTAFALTVPGSSCAAPASLPPGAVFKGCIAPSSSFLQTTSTGNTLYGSRQLQFGVRFGF